MEKMERLWLLLTPLLNTTTPRRAYPLGFRRPQPERNTGSFPTTAQVSVLYFRLI